MNTLLLTTPKTGISAKDFRQLERQKLKHWNIETVPSGSVGRVGSIPTVTMVRVGDETRTTELKSLISRLAQIQSNVPRGTYVLFAIDQQPKLTRQKLLPYLRRRNAIIHQINSTLPEFPNPDRVDIVDYAPALLDKLNLIETKLKIAPPRLSPLDQVKEVVEATNDLRVANGNLSATPVAETFGVSLNQLAGWLGRTRQALNKTPDADSLQDELAFFERVARLRAAVKKEGFLKWLRMANSHLDNKKPLELLANGQRQVVADLVDDMLTGVPA